jgi:hypothetical protein
MSDNNDTLVFERVNSKDEGTYTCEVTNRINKIKRDFLIDIDGKKQQIFIVFAIRIL